MFGEEASEAFMGVGVVRILMVVGVVVVVMVVVMAMVMVMVCVVVVVWKGWSSAHTPRAADLLKEMNKNTKINNTAQQKNTPNMQLIVTLTGIVGFAN